MLKRTAQAQARVAAAAWIRAHLQAGLWTGDPKVAVELNNLADRLVRPRQRPAPPPEDPNQRILPPFAEMSKLV